MKLTLKPIQQLILLKLAERRQVDLIVPLLATSLLATTGCNSLPGKSEKIATPSISTYNAERTPPPERMEQFFNPRNGDMVYRFCVGSECPEPTPKKPLLPMAVVTEIDAAGMSTQVEQKIQPSLADNDKPTGLPMKKPIDGWRARLQTAQNNVAAAAITAQLELQRRSLLEANGIGAPERVTPPDGKVPVKKLMESPRLPNAAVPSIPATPKPTGTVQDLVPTTGTRMPDKPQASLSLPQAPVNALATPIAEPPNLAALTNALVKSDIQKPAQRKAEALL